MSQIQPTGQQLRDAGIQQAADHADAVNPSWVDKTFEEFKKWLKHRDCKFLMEEFRAHCLVMELPQPPHNRAFGAISVRAAKEGLITRIGFESVKNPKAHCAPVGVWIKNEA